MIAADAGYFHALLDKRDAWHSRALAFALSLGDEVLVTTWPVLTEACHLLAGRLGPAFAIALMEDVLSQGICLLYTSPSPRDYAASRMPSSA